MAPQQASGKEDLSELIRVGPISGLPAAEDKFEHNRLCSLKMCGTHVSAWGDGGKVSPLHFLHTFSHFYTYWCCTRVHLGGHNPVKHVSVKQSR